MAKVAVVILNYNGEQYLRDFLPGVIQHSPEAEIVVADNCSSDRSRQLIKNQFASVTLLELTENHGYAGGYNEALKQVDAQYYLLLNSDVEVTAHWLTPLVSYLDSHPEFAAVQPKILDQKNREYFEYAGAAGGYLDYFGYPYCRGRVFDTLEKDTAQYDDVAEVFWCSGACFLIRAKAFHDIGGFDASFFAHMEEIDLCWRLYNSGHKLACNPKSVVYHVGGGTLNKTSPKKTYLNFRNNLIMLAKNEPASKLFYLLPVRFLLDLAAGLKFWKDQSFEHFLAVLKAQIHFVTHAKKRTGTFQQRKGVKLLNEYYFKGRKTFREINNTK
ncbi:MAG: glycosyltransferase family 2 protein [Cyclobacteriaceae bacterium]